MINLTLTEKQWDKVRPSSVKKTGLSEAIRTTTKALTKFPDTAAELDELDAHVVLLLKALGVAIGACAKAKDAAAATKLLNEWKKECQTARDGLPALKESTGLAKLAITADKMFPELGKQVDGAIEEAEKLIAKIKENLKNGVPTDQKTAVTQLQKYHGVVRDVIKAVHKDSFPKSIATFQVTLDFKLDPTKVPLPKSGKEVKAKLPRLEELLKELGGLLANDLAASRGNRVGKAAEAIKPLVAKYKQIHARTVVEAAKAKKWHAQVKSDVEKVKDLLAKGAKAEKLLPFVAKLHQATMMDEETSLKLIALGRVGSVFELRKSIRDELKKTSVDDYKEFETLASDEWNLCMAVYREVSEQYSLAHTQILRALRLIGDSSEDAKLVVSVPQVQYEKDVAELRKKYM